MILEEFIGVVVSIVSLLISRPSQISGRISRRESGSMSDESGEQDVPWVDMIHREYEETDQELQIQSYPYTSVPYVSVGSESRLKPTFCQSLQRSLRANLGIVLAVIPLGLFAMGLVYYKLNTSELCFEWKHHNNNSISSSVMRWRLIGEDIDAIPLNLWFPVTLALLFGWKKFKSNYISTLWVIYKTFLLVFKVFGTKMYYRYPGNALFLIGITWSSIIVAKKFKLLHPFTSYSRFHIAIVVSLDFVTGFAIAMIYKTLIIPYFNMLENEISKVIMAAIAPGVALIPTAVCKYLGLRQSSEMIQQDRSFLLAYFLRGASIALYRIMQADFKSTSLFVGLSLLHGFSNVLSKATEKLRVKMWLRFNVCLRKTFFGRRLELLPLDTPHYRRFKADIEIQDMLFEYNTLIGSQVYIVLYLITSFNMTSSWLVVKGSLIRMAIGLAIDFVFNCISVFIVIHYHDVPMRRVWFKCWKRHVIANAVMLMVIILFFTPVLLLVFQVRQDRSAKKYAINNCTLPFGSW